jgi:hypothetical protein
MADVKEVKVTITEKDAKQFARTTTRKRKMKGGDNTSEIEDFRLNKLNGDEPKKPEPAVIPVVNAPTIVPATSNISSPPVSSNPIAPVKIIQEKKAAVSSLNAPAVVGSLNATAPKTPLNGGGGSVTKIIPKKKHLTKAPTATTLKKPALMIAAAAAHPKNIASIPEGGVTRRRRFAERKISVPIRSAAVTRKQTHSLKERIAAMPIANVRKMLLRKGLIKAAARTPEDMARSLLLEYMLLHHAE